MTKRASTASTATSVDPDELADRRFIEKWKPRKPPPGWSPEGCNVRRYTKVVGLRTVYVEVRSGLAN